MMATGRSNYWGSICSAIFDHFPIGSKISIDNGAVLSYQSERLLSGNAYRGADVTRDHMRQELAWQVKDDILMFEYADYDLTGDSGAFALTGSLKDGIYAGKLWYIDKDGVAMLRDQDAYVEINGGHIDNILYRGNEYLSFTYENGTLEQVGQGEGVYLPALSPAIAVYPDGFNPELKTISRDLYY